LISAPQGQNLLYSRTVYSTGSWDCRISLCACVLPFRCWKK